MVEVIRPQEAFEVLRKEPFGENEQGLVSVYHITWRSLLRDISTYGLRPDRFGTGFMLGVESETENAKRVGVDKIQQRIADFTFEVDLDI